MTSASPAAASTAPPVPWSILVLRAVPALGVGLAITFIADHSSALGIAMLAAFGLATALVLVLTSARAERSQPLRSLGLGLAAIAGTVGVLAVVALAFAATSLAMLLLIVGGYAVLAGALELVWGIRHRGRSALARDAIVIGSGTLALAIVLAFVGDPVSAVGFFGAYAVILGIFLVIAGFSLRWSAPASSTRSSTPGPVEPPLKEHSAS